MIRVGDELPAKQINLTRQDIVRYAGASGDFNPIHYSDRHAQALGLAGVVVHGMWTMGAALRIVTDWIGDPGAVQDYFVRFVSPILVPDDDEGVVVEVRGKVTAVEAGLATVGIDVSCDGEKILGAAKAVVRVD